MIRHLTLQDVGPARTLKFDFAPRLNVLTGDNGLGKTFVLDVLWWVLTTTWVAEPAFPWRPPTDILDLGNLDGDGDGHGGGYGGGAAAGAGFGDGRGYGGGAAARQESDVSHADGSVNPSIIAELASPIAAEEAPRSVEGSWQWDTQEWLLESAPEVSRGLVVYARIDGSYAIWDAYYARAGAQTSADAAIVLANHEVWDGKEVADADAQGGKRTVIRGLIADWANWQQRRRSPEFEALRRVLHALSSPDEPLLLGEPTRVHLHDRRDIPTLVTSYGTVPVTHASAGVRRILALAYLLVWSFAEHVKAAKQRRQKPTRDVVVLIDEPEMHLHPAWQRVLLPSLFRAIGMTAPNAAVQLFTATHSPIVLSSLESVFREELDDLFVLSRDGSLVQANEESFSKEGDVSNWLSSKAFGYVGSRSREATLAIDAAMDFMANRKADAEHNLRKLGDIMQELPAQDPKWLVSLTDKHESLKQRIHEALKFVLPSHDEFWVQWVGTYEQSARGPRRRR